MNTPRFSVSALSWTDDVASCITPSNQLGLVSILDSILDDDDGNLDLYFEWAGFMTTWWFVDDSNLRYGYPPSELLWPQIMEHVVRLSIRGTIKEKTGDIVPFSVTFDDDPIDNQVICLFEIPPTS
jgi:hypothetical protein